MQFITVFAAYFIAGKLGQATANVRSNNLGPVWPAYGIALAAILLCGYRIWPAVSLGMFVIAVSSPEPYLTALGQTASSLSAALIGAFLLHRVTKFENAVSRLRDVFALILLGAFAFVSVANALCVWISYRRKEHHSTVPLLGAICGALGLWLISGTVDRLAPRLWTPWYTALPFVLDVGTLVLLVWPWMLAASAIRARLGRLKS